MGERLKAEDTDHFWFDGVLIDLVALRYELESLNKQASRDQWWDVHERNRVFGNLRRCAEYLNKEEPAKDSWAAHTEEDLRDANKHGLHTGWKKS